MGCGRVAGPVEPCGCGSRTHDHAPMVRPAPHVNRPHPELGECIVGPAARLSLQQDPPPADSDVDSQRAELDAALAEGMLFP
jgi:hypothetical protein